MWAAQLGSVEVVYLLLGEGNASIDLRDRVSNATGLRRLYKNTSRISTYCFLLFSYPILQRGFTALMHAARFGRTAVVEFLIRGCANKHLTNRVWTRFNHIRGLHILLIAGLLLHYTVWRNCLSVSGVLRIFRNRRRNLSTTCNHQQRGQPPGRRCVTLYLSQSWCCAILHRSLLMPHRTRTYVRSGAVEALSLQFSGIS